ncbi:lipid-A-disaccharide kinase [Fibrobacter sp. UWB16]|uniref:tetraacyldisaccharide 4'-kinase n=1 Tax=Fibrobacter sp. UWB16 TaxID=1945874 RepID=UPI000BCD7C2D|nr:tetraacyldisaccharide 4'-kinase [Fibrobacter sp. UWB16]SOD15529.1 lipid-A-disaccharide kinase [Fibrobacter sp. UWB16]
MIYTTKPFRLAAAAFYRIAYKLHHKIFLRPQPPIQTPVIIVGSYLAGGAGKTPFTIWLAKRLQEQGKKVAVLCHSAAWDEFILLQNSLSHSAKVIATSNRYSTAKEIQDKFDIILCDDGFEDSRFTGAHRICLDWEEPPTSWTKLWPAGPFRSLKQDHDESEIIHIRCFDADSQTPDIRFYIKSITNYIPGKPLSATLICGLGSPKRFIDDIGTFAASTGIQINKVITRPDHDKHFAQVVQKEISCGNDIIISQKDACRLPQTNLEHPKLHIAIQEIEVSAHLTLHSS